MPEGGFAVLVGPSGCGKSTLLRVIAGLEQADAGEIRFGDRDVTRLAPRDRDIAMVFQSYALYPHLTVRDNLAFGLSIRKTDKAEIARRIAEVAPMLGLEKLLDRLPRELSRQGLTVVMLSSEVDEHVELMDRVLVFREGSLATELTRAELSRDRLVDSFFGGAAVTA